MAKTPEIYGLATLNVTSITGVTLAVIDIPPGLYAGYPAAVSDERQVEFYDTRYSHTIFGQFTGGRYRASDFLSPSRAERSGLALNGTERDWTISPRTYNTIVRWLKER